MGTVHFNANKMLNEVIPLINNCSTDLTSAKSVLGSIVIPSDFAYAGELKGLSYKIDGLIQCGTALSGMVKDCVSRFSNAESSSLALIDLIGGSGSVLTDDTTAKLNVLYGRTPIDSKGSNKKKKASEAKGGKGKAKIAIGNIAKGGYEIPFAQIEDGGYESPFAQIGNAKRRERNRRKKAKGPDGKTAKNAVKLPDAKKIVNDIKNNQTKGNGSNAQGGAPVMSSFANATLNDKSTTLMEETVTDEIVKKYEEAGLSQNRGYNIDPDEKKMIIQAIMEKYTPEDIAKMDNEQINEVVINAKKDASYTIMKEYSDEKGKYYTDVEIRETIDNIKIYKDDNELKTEYYENNKNDLTSQDNAQYVEGFHDGKQIYISADTTIANIVHGVMHSRGDVKRNTVNDVNDSFTYDTGINEALTQLNTIKATGIPDKSRYEKTVKVLGEITDGLNQTGYKDIEYNTYFGEDRLMLSKALNERCNWVTGASNQTTFYDELTYQMYQYNENLSNPEIREEASKQLDNLLSYFKECNLKYEK